MSHVNIPPTPRGIAFYIAAYNTTLEGRVAFAEAILPVVERYASDLALILYVDQMIPGRPPAAQWRALAADHLAFLCPEVPTLDGRAEQDIAEARDARP